MHAISHGTIGCMPENHAPGRGAGGRISLLMSDTALALPSGALLRRIKQNSPPSQ